MNRHLVRVTVLLMLATLVLIVPAGSEIAGVNYAVTYSVVDDIGFLSVTLNVTGVDCAVYHVPVRVFDDREVYIEFLNYTAVGTTVVGVNYNTETGIAEVAACSPGVVELVFAISGLLEELGAGAYSLVVDTSELSNMGLITLELRLGIPVDFEVQVTGDLRVDLEDGERGILLLKGLGVGTITLIIPAETPTPELTPTPTPTLALQPQLTYAAVAIAFVAVAIIVILVLKRRK